MPMMDWNTCRSQMVATVGELGKLSPDTVRGYAARTLEACAQPIHRGHDNDRNGSAGRPESRVRLVTAELD